MEVHPGAVAAWRLTIHNGVVEAHKSHNGGWRLASHNGGVEALKSQWRRGGSQVTMEAWRLRLGGSIGLD
jgi:hypothetical protein